MKRARGYTLIEIIITLAILALVAALLAVALKPKNTSKVPPSEVSVPVGAKVEATGDRIVSVMRTDETEQGLVRAVTEWLKSHPDYEIETITPAEFNGGGDFHISVNSYLYARPRDLMTSEQDHFMECRVCGQAFDMRDLSAVFFHEHRGIGKTPGLDECSQGKAST